jgi:hypothetical protein
MKQCICGQPLQEQLGDYDMKSLLVDTVQVPRIRSEACLACGNRYIDFEQAKIVSQWVDRAEVAAVALIPASEFVLRAEALKILGMTAPEFRQNQRIRNGFVIWRTPGRQRHYLRKSLELFRDTKDGRFNILDMAKPEPLPTLRLKNPKLPGRQFQYENHCLTLGYGNISNFEGTDLHPGWKAVGWCPGTNVEFKPSDMWHGLMVEDDRTFEKAWSHVPPALIAKFFPSAIPELKQLDHGGGWTRDLVEPEQNQEMKSK